MPDKFQNKYRIPSARAPWWDYQNEAAYFVTICRRNREHYFGEIHNGQMQLSEFGGMVQTEWLKTVEMRLDMNLKMGAYVVMPNHFQRILMAPISKNVSDHNPKICHPLFVVFNRR